MTTTLVYRLEDATGEGAFQAVDIDAFGDLMGELGFDDPHKTHPAPWEDGDDIARTFEEHAHDPAWVCGCKDLAQLQWWFPRETIGLLGGQQVTVWEVPADEVTFGKHQVMFDRAVAKCIERKPVDALYY